MHGFSLVSEIALQKYYLQKIKEEELLKKAKMNEKINSFDKKKN